MILYALLPEVLAFIAALKEKLHDISVISLNETCFVKIKTQLALDSKIVFSSFTDGDT